MNEIMIFASLFLSLCFQYFSEYKVVKITTPTLFLSGQQDELIPPAMMQSLYNVNINIGKLIHVVQTENKSCIYICVVFFIQTLNSGKLMCRVNDEELFMASLLWF